MLLQQSDQGGSDRWSMLYKWRSMTTSTYSFTQFLVMNIQRYANSSGKHLLKSAKFLKTTQKYLQKPHQNSSNVEYKYQDV